MARWRARSLPICIAISVPWWHRGSRPTSCFTYDRIPAQGRGGRSTHVNFFFYRPASSPDVYSPLLENTHDDGWLEENWIWASPNCSPSSMKFRRIKISIIPLVLFAFQNILVNSVMWNISGDARRAVARRRTSLTRSMMAVFLLRFFSSFFSTFLSLSLSLFFFFSSLQRRLFPFTRLWRKLRRFNNDEKLVTDDRPDGTGRDVGLLLYTPYRFHAAFKYSISPLTLVAALPHPRDDAARIFPRVASSPICQSISIPRSSDHLSHERNRVRGNYAQIRADRRSLRDPPRRFFVISLSCRLTLPTHNLLDRL